MKNILLTIDFDQNDRLLFDKAMEIAQAFRSKVWVLHIAEPDPDFVGYRVGPQYIRDSIASERRKEHKQIQEYAARFKEKGIEAESLLIQGATIEMILEESKKLHVDLIIAGHHKRGFLYNAMVGSVSAHVMNKSKIPVLVVPLGEA